MVKAAGKRVLFVKEGRDIYGAERATLRLFSCLDRERIDPGLLLLEYSAEPSPFLTAACDQDIAVFVTYSPKELGKKLAELASEYDVVVSIGYKCHILSWWYGRKTSLERYAICHGWVATDLKLKIYNWLAKRCLRSCAGVMTVSPTIEVPNSNCTVVYNGVDVEKLCRAADEPLPCLEALGSKTFVVYVGRLELEKGVLELVKAFKEPVEGAELVIVGAGSLEGELRRIADDNGSPITFLGYQENPAPIIKRASCLILPSATEALPLVMLEAMALKTPVLATPVGAVPDVITDGNSGFHLASNSTASIVDGVANVLRDPQLSETVTDKAYETVISNFSDHAVADRVCNVITKIDT